ncbi:hypothetical protein ACFWG5_39185 [Streptomyces hydrogenans]
MAVADPGARRVVRGAVAGTRLGALRRASPSIGAAPEAARHGRL